MGDESDGSQEFLISSEKEPKKRGRPPGSSLSADIKELKELLSGVVFELKSTKDRLNKLEVENCVNNNDVINNNSFSDQDKLSQILLFQISNSLPVIKGNENKKILEVFFRKFEIASFSLSDNEKVRLLVGKLEDRALLTFDGLPLSERINYESIKRRILGDVEDHKSRVINQRSLFSGVKKFNNESLLCYDKRLFKLVQDSFLPSASHDVIEDVAKTQFLDNIDNLHVRTSLALCRESFSFDQLLSKAISLYDDLGIVSRADKPNPSFGQFKSSNNFSDQSRRSNQVAFSRFSPPPRNTFLSQSRKVQACIFCSGSHASSTCPTYKSLSNRLDRLVILNRCKVCTRSSHSTDSCRVKVYCPNCRGDSHHPFLCPKGDIASRLSQVDVSNRSSVNSHSAVNRMESTLSQVAKVSDSKRLVLLKCVRCRVFNPNSPSLYVDALILLDDGSTTSYIKSSVAKRLKLSSHESEVITFNVFNEVSTQELKTDLVSFQISLANGSVLELFARTISNIGAPLPHAIVDAKSLDGQFGSVEYGSPDILIGGDFYYKLNITSSHTLQEGFSVLNSDLGQIIAGPGSLEITHQSSYKVVNFCHSLDSSLNQRVSQFFELDIIGIKDEVSESFSLECFQDSIKFNGDRYEASLPWKQFPPNLSSNFGLSFGRLKSTLRYLNSKPDLFNQYNGIIQKQLEDGVIEVVDDSDRNPNVHYFPHQAVLRSGSSKVRIVYDASAKASKCSSSLNDCLHTGPLLLQNLSGILLRFRIHPIVILADIEKAFLQIALKSEDRDFTRFLWVREPSVVDPRPNQLIKYRFCRVAFGISCSPFLLALSLLTHFKRHPSTISEDVLLNLYVDNIMLTASSSESAKQKVVQLKDEFLKLSMNIREFLSNDLSALCTLNKGDVLENGDNKVLGLNWNNLLDTIQFRVFPPKLDQIVSKQFILSYIASIFDPLGLLTPALLPLKVFFQKLWSENIQWSDQIPQSLLLEWSKIATSIKETVFKLNRHVAGSSLDHCSHELHAFSDASGYAFSCCVYLRTSTSTSSQCNLIFAKSKVYPKRLKDKLSIHRAELLGLLIAVRAIQFCQSELVRDSWLKETLSKDLNLWTDSSTILHWLRSSVKQDTFVENRLKEISRCSNLLCKYVNTAENPADYGCRGCSFVELSNNKRWWNGPTWLMESTVSSNFDIPSFSSNSQNPRQATEHQFVCNTTPSISHLVLDPSRYQSWPKMVRVLGYVLRFFNSVVTKTRTNSSSNSSVALSLSELRNAELKLFFVAQQERLPTEEERSSLKLFDDAGLYRCRGRIEHSHCSESAKFPIWMSPKSRFTYLLVYHLHRSLLHLGPISLLNYLRQFCWVAKGRKTVSQIINNFCLQCRKLTCKPYASPPPPALPSERVCRSSVFQHCGTDYLGPIIVKGGSKVWCCLFTCLSVRAIHLELVDSLSAEAFIEAFRRFVSRRGKPMSLISDNGKNFLLSRKVIDSSLQKNPLHSTEYSEFLNLHGVKWSLITERAPWKGGFFERLIGMVKYHIRRVVAKAYLKSTKLHTLLTEIEFIVNCRPLTFVSDNLNGPRPIRPIDFLSPNANTNILCPLPLVDSQTSSGSTRDILVINWQHSLSKLDKFWKQWSSEYLLSLRERANKLSNSKSERLPQNGDVVIVLDENRPRNHWKLALVDGNKNISADTRTVQIKLPSGTVTKRSVRHLFPIETTFE